MQTHFLARLTVSALLAVTVARAQTPLSPAGETLPAMPTVALTEVAVRMKEVQFSSRTRAATDKFRKLAELRTAFNELLAQMPPALAGTP